MCLKIKKKHLIKSFYIDEYIAKNENTKDMSDLKFFL